MDLPDPISWQLERKQRENGLEKSQSWFSLFPRVQPILFKEKLTMKMDSLVEEKLECSLWCCLSDPSIPGRCCVLERHIVPWMWQESYSSSSPIWFVDSDEPNLTSVLERLEDDKNNNSVRKEAKLFSLFLINIVFRN
ncbi:putative ubiquitin-conjugating enzyme E2Q2-like protein [Pan paniscus]|uniref:putative ubiquitin-conjugating enzyme E2Q2-like protein n=1 Tax=Pan paniscus TaxID=9597 RepID=UPI0024372989|nr:putative ubiquitin-conjugating enzyme E2Q2-like protein [Pan paniscus]